MVQQNGRSGDLQVSAQQSIGKRSSNRVRGPASPGEVVCEHWADLVKHYQANAKMYAEAVAELSTAPGAEFNNAWMRSEGLRRASIGYRAALLEHEHEHGCLFRVDMNPSRGR